MVKGAYLFPLIAAILLAVLESDLLYRLQEQNLFLHSPLFFEQQTIKAGGVLTWTGCYLTQFFYYPMLGAGLLCLLWAFLMWMLSRAFHIPSSWMPLTLVPVACLLLTIVDLGYWTYYLKLPGHAFDATIGSIVAVGLVWIYRILPRRYGLSALFIAFSTCISYPLFGFYGLLATMLMGIIAWQMKGGHLTDSIAALLAIIMVPWVCYQYAYHETNLVNIYWTALPVFAMRQESYFAYNLPYVALVASLVLLAVGRPAKINKWIQTAVLTATMCCVTIFWYKDGNFHKELSMSRSIEQQDWQEVLNTAKTVKDEPTRAMCMMQNLALFRLGKQGKELFNYPNGAKRPDAPFPIRMVHTFGKMLYLQYGIPNYCFRWCVEDGVEYGWSVEKLKLMVKCSILNGESVAAQRFVNMLKKTDFHKEWAKKYEEYIYNPHLVIQDRELGPILPLLRSDDFLTGDQSQLEMFLIEHILSGPGATLEQQDLAAMTMYYYKNNPYKIAEQ